MSDNKETIYCPACGKEMKKLYIPDSGVNIDICVDGCGGMYFDNRELEKFDELHENADKIFEAIQGKTFAPVEEAVIRICPVCQTPMVKSGVSGSFIEIDVCNVCGGKFLDNGELQKVREADKNPDDTTINNILNLAFEVNIKDAIGEKLLSYNGIKGADKSVQVFRNLVSKF